MAPFHWERKHPIEQMHDYGGGGGGVGAAVRFFYLVVKSGEPEGALDPTDVQSFFRSGVNTDESYAFTFIDINSDARLKDDLLKIENGPEFYQRLEASVPAFLITYVPISKLFNASVIKLYPISDYQKDAEVIYEHMGMNTPSVRQAAITFLRKLNSYSHLKPNVLGIGLNLNEVIADLLTRLEHSTP
jgi:hypothetical protein